MKYTIIQPIAQTTHELWKPVVVENRFTWETEGKEKVWYEVSLDPAALENMARKAVDNERQISRAGPVRVRVLKRERLP
jgi:hypothetical protein